MSPTPSTPLFPNASAPAAPAGPTPLSRTTARLAGTARVLFGAACILAPTLTSRLFSLPSPPVAVLLLGFSGARDLVLGELLLLADKDKDRAGARRVLWGIAAVDTLDLCCACVAFMKGGLPWEGFAVLSAVAAAGVGLVGEALWGY